MKIRKGIGEKDILLTFCDEEDVEPKLSLLVSDKQVNFPKEKYDCMVVATV